LLYSNVARRERERKALEMLTRVGLAERVYHNPNELSGGEAEGGHSQGPGERSRDSACRRTHRQP
jgi:hypothetical protein